MKVMRNFAASALLFTLPLVSYAEDSGFYVGGGVGGSNFSNDLTHQIQTAYVDQDYWSLESAKVTDHSDTAFKVLGGYRFLSWLSVELAWVDLGNAETHYRLIRNPNGASFVYADITGEYRLDGVTLAVAGQYNFSDHFGVAARMGVFASRLKYAEHGLKSVQEPYKFIADDERDTNTLIGLGASWRPHANWEIRFDWDRYLNVGTRFDLTATTNGKFDHVDMYGLNLLYHFGG